MPVPQKLLAISAAALFCILTGCGREEMKPPEVIPPPDGGVAAELPLSLRLVRSLAAVPEKAVGIASGPNGTVVVAGSAEAVVLSADGAVVQRWAIPERATCVACDGTERIFVGHARRVSVYGLDGKGVGSWGSAGRGDGQLWLVRGMSVSGMNVYLADAGNRCIHRFAADGDYIGTLGRKDSDAGIPGIVVPSGYLDCVALGDDAVLVTNPGRWLVERYTPTGELKASFGKRGLSVGQFPGCCNPTNIEAIGSDGRLVAAADKSIPRVQLFTLSGQVQACTDAGVFSDDAKGIDLARGPAGTLYALDVARQAILLFEIVEQSSDRDSPPSATGGGGEALEKPSREP